MRLVKKLVDLHEPGAGSGRVTLHVIARRAGRVVTWRVDSSDRPAPAGPKACPPLGVRNSFERTAPCSVRSMLLRYTYVPGDGTNDGRVALKHTWSGDVMYSYVSFEETYDIDVLSLYAKELIRLRYKNDPVKDLSQFVNKLVYYMIAGRLSQAFRSCDVKEGLLLRDDAGVVAVCFGTTRQDERLTSDFSRTSVFVSLFDNDSYGKFRPVSTFFFNRYTTYAVLSIPNTWKTLSDHDIISKIKDQYIDRHERNSESPFTLFMGFPQFVMNFFRDLVIECSVKSHLESSGLQAIGCTCGRHLENDSSSSDEDDKDGSDEETYDSCSSDVSEDDEPIFDVDDDFDFAFVDDVIDNMMITIGKRQATTKILISMIRSVINRIDRDEWRMPASEAPKFRLVARRASSFCLRRTSTAMDNLAAARQRADQVAFELLMEEKQETAATLQAPQSGGGSKENGAQPFVLPQTLPADRDALREILQQCEKEFAKARDASKRLKKDAPKTVRNAVQERVKRAHTARESTKNALKTAEKKENDRAEAEKKKRDAQKEAERIKQHAEERAAREAMHALEEAERKAHLEQSLKMLASLRVENPDHPRASAEETPKMPHLDGKTAVAAIPVPIPIILPLSTVTPPPSPPPLPAYLQPGFSPQAPQHSLFSPNNIWVPPPPPPPPLQTAHIEHVAWHTTMPMYPAFMFPLPLQPSPWAAVAASVSSNTTGRPQQQNAHADTFDDDSACIVCMETPPDTTTTCCKRTFMCSLCAVRVKRCPLCDSMEFACLPDELL